jgi:hypothetical protein
MNSLTVDKQNLGTRLLFAGGAAAAQVITITLVSVLWRVSAGRWGPGAWLLYFMVMCVAGPLLGVMIGRKLARSSVQGPRILKTVVVLGLANGVFAFAAHGFEEGGISMPVYVSGYGILLLVIVLGLGTRRGLATMKTSN